MSVSPTSAVLTLLSCVAVLTACGGSDQPDAKAAPVEDSPASGAPTEVPAAAVTPPGSPSADPGLVLNLTSTAPAPGQLKPVSGVFQSCGVQGEEFALSTKVLIGSRTYDFKVFVRPFKA